MLQHEQFSFRPFCSLQRHACYPVLQVSGGVSHTRGLSPTIAVMASPCKLPVVFVFEHQRESRCDFRVCMHPVNARRSPAWLSRQGPFARTESAVERSRQLRANTEKCFRSKLPLSTAGPGSHRRVQTEAPKDGGQPQMSCDQIPARRGQAELFCVFINSVAPVSSGSAATARQGWNQSAGRLHSQLAGITALITSAAV